MRLLQKSIALALMLCLAVACTGVTAASEGIPEKVLRFHVLANSDSEEDQALKLLVRDRLLETSGAYFEGALNREEAEAAAGAHLSDLKRDAEAVLRENGSADTVRVELEDCWFPTRTYGATTLPAGNYRALRVLIGAGEGRNWWCVLFPALCLPGAEPKKELSDVLTPAQEQVTQSGFSIKFKTVELYEQIKAFFAGEA